MEEKQQKRVIKLIFVPVGISCLFPYKYSKQEIIEKLQGVNEVEKKHREEYWGKLYNDKDFIDMITVQQSKLYKKSDYSNLSADLASLRKLEKEKDIVKYEKKDKIYLLGTDNWPGKISLKVNELVLKEHLTDSKILEAKTIEDLGVQDKKKYDKGINNAVNFICDRFIEIMKEKDEKTEIHPYLNITTGFKGLQPIVSLISLALGFEMFYKPEDFPDLIRIPCMADVNITLPPKVYAFRESFKKVKEIKDMIPK